MASRTSALNLEAYLHHNGRLTHDEELDLMEQGISLREHYGLLPDQYMQPPQDFLPCRLIEKYDLTSQYGAHSLGSAEHALLAHRLTAGALLPNAVAPGGCHGLDNPSRADSVMAGTGAAPEVEPHVGSPDIKTRIEELHKSAPVNVKHSIEVGPDEIPLKRQKKVNEIDENEIRLKLRKKSFEIDGDFQDETPLKPRKKNSPTHPSAPKLKLKFKVPPPPSPSNSQPTPPAPSTSTPRKRTRAKPKHNDNDNDSDEEYHPDPPRSLNTIPSLPSSARSISPPARPNLVFAPGMREIPEKIHNIIKAVGEVKKGKDGLPQRTGLRKTEGFTGRDGIMGSGSLLWEWYGDTRVFEEREWRYFGSNEEGRRRRGGGGRVEGR